MDEPAPMTGPNVTPSWRQEPRGHPDEVQARRLKRKTWTLLAVLAVALGALLGLASSFRSRPYPAFLPIVVGEIQESGGPWRLWRLTWRPWRDADCLHGRSVIPLRSVRPRRSPGGSSGWAR